MPDLASSKMLKQLNKEKSDRKSVCHSKKGDCLDRADCFVFLTILLNSL